jgi:hypothetical protein
MSDDLLLSSEPAAKTPRRHDDKEHRLQTWAHKLMEKIIREPRFIHAIDHASIRTDNARSRAASAGVQFGFPDYQIFQTHPTELIVLHIEFKAAPNSVGERQRAVHAGLERLGMKTLICYSMDDVLRGLERAGVWLHGNAANLAIEYQHRFEASNVKAKARGPRKAGEPRQPKPTAAGLRFGRTRGILGGQFGKR